MRRAASPLTLDGLLRPHGAAMEADVAQLAGRLRAAGLTRGDAHCFRAPPAPETDLLYRACWRLGVTAVALHHLAGADEVARIVDDLHPRLDPAAELPVVAPPVTQDQAEPDDIAVVLFTSGSSGRPKGVRHSHRALASKARTMIAVHGLTDADVVLMPAPAAHVSGLLNGVLVAGAAGMRTVWMARWDPVEALALIEAEGVTFMVGPPTFFLDLMGAPGFAPERVASLRLISSGGAGVTPAFVDRASAELGAVVKRTYGSTEAPSVTTSFAGDDPVKARETDGRPVGDGRLRVDPANGELQVHTADLFVGYTDPAATAAVMTDDGWYRTGDVGVIDADGWLTIVGRIADVIIRGGENIGAAEVEGVLDAHPAVVASVVVGFPDERLGERVAAFVVAPGGFTLDACREWFADQGVARYKTPERVVVVDELPRLASGKPDRAALRARATAQI